MASRETFDLWWDLFHRYPNGDWRGYRLFTKRFWRYGFFWHDSFGRYLNWFILCPLLGHRKVQNVADPGEEKMFYCFCCDRKVKEEE